jgi:signal transduction histidine kinase/CheY-like chemotaxis protein
VSASLGAVRIREEHDVVVARQRARDVAAALGFEATDQVRIATAVSEIARNAYVYARGGDVEYLLDGLDSPPPVLVVRIADAGPGIARLEDVLAGRYRSSTGMGLGMVGARRLMDHFDVQTSPAGTTVSLKRLVPRHRTFTSGDLAQLVRQLETPAPSTLYDEVRQQNQELLRALEELQARQTDIERINRELEDTNRGVVALYAELDERADHLRRADELKTRFLSNMTHEFRTPVNSILALCRLISERLGTSSDQKDEVYYIRRSAQQLSELVDDLLDIAKVEAGKIEIQPAVFEVPSLFSALRGMLRPLLVNQSVRLVFEEPEDVPPVVSDESKVSQILRNFISNALKYTDRGDVRVTACFNRDRQCVQFHVTDTGIGIAAADLPRIFDEFVQIENPLQQRTKGTGLGLPLSKRLAALLEGEIEVESQIGVGSTFSLTLPLVHSLARHDRGKRVLDERRLPVLVVEDADEDMLLYERALAASPYQAIPVRSVSEAEAALDALVPAAVVLDLRMQGQEAWGLLARLKRTPSPVPVIMASQVDERRKSTALGADAYAVKPVDPRWLVETLDRLVRSSSRPAATVLAIDDEETFRFILRNMLGSRYVVHEAASGAEGLERAAAALPDVVLLDYQLSDMSGLDVFERLPAEVRLRVILITSQPLTAEIRGRFGPRVGVISKSTLTAEALQSAIAQAMAGVAPQESR